MTINGWCRNNYHKDGKRRFAKLTDGFCCECQADQQKTQSVSEPVQKIVETVEQSVGKRRKQSAEDKKKAAEKRKITYLEQKIVDLEVERDNLNSEINRLRFKWQALISSLNQSGVEKSGIKSGAKT